MLKAAYRFFDNDGIAPQDILQSHVEATYTRLGAVPVVLAVQETTAVNWTRHPATQGLGPLGHTACHGLLVHTTLAITPERVPLGLLAQQVGARAPAAGETGAAQAAPHQPERKAEMAPQSRRRVHCP